MVPTVSEKVFRGILCGLLVAGCIGPDGGALDPDGNEVDETRYGTLAVGVETTGPNPDPNGYLVMLDESMSTTIPSTGEAAFNGVATGLYSIRLEDVDPPCTVQGIHPLSLYVFPDTTVLAEFDVDCP